MTSFADTRIPDGQRRERLSRPRVRTSPPFPRLLCVSRSDACSRYRGCTPRNVTPVSFVRVVTGATTNLRNPVPARSILRAAVCHRGTRAIRSIDSHGSPLWSAIRRLVAASTIRRSSSAGGERRFSYLNRRRPFSRWTSSRGRREKRSNCRRYIARKARITLLHVST